MSRIEDKVCEKIQQRAKIGKSKYGVTMERADLNFLEWLQHLQEEADGRGSLCRAPDARSKTSDGRSNYLHHLW